MAGRIRAMDHAEGDGMSTALDESIEHWQRLVACKTLDEVEKEGIESDDCALCEEYQYTSEESCAGCPIFFRTTQRYCRGTPYGKIAVYIQRCWDDECEFDAELWQQLSQAELDFLKSLKVTA